MAGVVALVFAVCGCRGRPLRPDGGSAGRDGAGGAATGGGGGGARMDAASPGGSGGSGVDAPAPEPADAADAVDRPACGLPGQPCCARNTCSGGGCCLFDHCVAPGAACGHGLEGTCANGACGACGGAGQACCAGATCTAPGVICQGGACVTCGQRAGDPCCDDGSCSAPGTFCDRYWSNLCESCGHPKEPCCPVGGCAGGVCCAGNTCSGPKFACVACGDEGQPCCGGACRSPTNTCSTLDAPSTCVA
jgi:hypothetical protein